MASPDEEVTPSDLRFRFQSNKQLQAKISINNRHSQRIAYKIKTTTPKKYVVRPSLGVVEPHSKMSIQIIMQAQKEYAPEFAKCKDKFMVQTTVLGDTEHIVKDMFNKDVRKNLKEYRLRVTIEEPTATPSPVPEANEADDEGAVARAAAAPPPLTAPQTAPPPAAEPAAAVDPRLRSALDNPNPATLENQQLKGQLVKLQRDLDELRRQVNPSQLQGGASKMGAAAASQTAVALTPRVSLVMVMLAVAIAFLLGLVAAPVLAKLAARGGLGTAGCSAV